MAGRDSGLCHVFRALQSVPPYHPLCLIAAPAPPLSCPCLALACSTRHSLLLLFPASAVSFPVAFRFDRVI
ncbi:hypothetical protein E2C01_065269 [Portunus trituberculatus]|uniref:Uncharacterized protein n=1 Tax=Portunus trituberculatus TaxID=210409 RepID=A0A5B7HIE2_PORTR|nr:hypothetical protein [Portunus trituberculatus]